MATTFTAPSLRRRTRPFSYSDNADVSDLQSAHRIASRWGSHGLTYMGLRKENRILFSTDGTACIGYVTVAGSAVALGPPCGPRDAAIDLLRLFRSACQRESLRAVLCGLSEELASAAKNVGFRITSVGDEALVDLAGVDLRGKRWREVRAALNRAQRKDVAFHWIEPEARTLCLQEKLQEVSRFWLTQKRFPELGFALGSMEALADPAIRLGVAIGSTGDIEGFASWIPIPATGGWMLEMLRYRPAIMAGMADFLVASSLLGFREEGVRQISLSGTPLADGSAHGRTFRSVLRSLLAPARPLYDFEGLRHFKQKFNPSWRQLYIAHSGAAGLPHALWCIARACAPDLSLPSFARLTLATMLPHFAKR